MKKMKNRIATRLLTMTLAVALILSIIPADNVFAFASITLKTVDFGGVTYDVTKDEDLAWEVLDLVNQERRQYGLSDLTMDKRLMDVAMGRSAEITRNFSHLRPNGTQCFTAYPMASQANGYKGLQACAENIAAGQLTAAAVMKAWMNSQGHKSNILSTKYKSIGIGCVRTGHGYNVYWVQSFGDKVIEEAVREAFDFSVAGIIRGLSLTKVTYKPVAAYGHFGRPELDLPWEKLDKKSDLQVCVIKILADAIYKKCKLK